MGISAWLGQNWLDVVQTVGIIASLIFAGITLRDDTRERRVENLLLLTQGHRDLWSTIFARPDLARIFDASADLDRKPLTLAEQLLVKQVIQHLYSAFEAMNNNLVIRPAALRRDVGEFFRLPIPAAVWKDLEKFQNPDFVAFVELCREGK